MNSSKMANSLVVLDFETTGLSPDMGDRAIEIGAVRLIDGKITERFQSLMYPGRPISEFIEGYTGISNEMLANAPHCAQVMSEFSDFIADDNLVAHNSSFDKRFLDAELERLNIDYVGQFACSLLVARRVYQDAPNHKLGSLISYKHIPAQGEFHRALFDSEMTAQLWLLMLDEIKTQINADDVPIELIQQLSTTPKKTVKKLFSKWANHQT